MITVSILLPPYLAQWAANRYSAEKLNNSPLIRPVKGSPISLFLRAFLRHKKDAPNIGQQSSATRGAVRIAADKVFIEVPYFQGRDPQYYNYLSPVAEAQLRDMLRSIFDIELFRDFAKFDSQMIQTSEFIYSWLDAHGIEANEVNWLAVSKRLALLQLRDNDRKRKRKNNLS